MVSRTIESTIESISQRSVRRALANKKLMRMAEESMGQIHNREGVVEADQIRAWFRDQAG